MRNAGGYALIASPLPSKVFLSGKQHDVSAGILEIDTFTCKHCNGVIHVMTRERADEYFCRNCMARICGPCADHPCIPFIKQIELREAKAHALRSYNCD